MKIKKINIPIEIASSFGLKPISMDRLNEVVLIAGKNGAGKTRLLNVIQEVINIRPKAHEIKVLNDTIKNGENSINILEKDIIAFQAKLDEGQLSNEQKKEYTERIDNQKLSIKHWNKELYESRSKLNYLEYIVLDSNTTQGTNHLVEFVPKSTQLVDSYKVSEEQLETFAKVIYTIGTKEINNGALSAIHLAQKMFFNIKSSEDLQIREEDRKKIVENYERLKKYIALFLNTELQRNEQGQPLLFGKRIGESQLSDGQKILLQFCVALYAQETDLENLIILMDEPENHLHPAALIEVLDKITPHVKNGQIWIATHSLNVLAHFDPSSIWYVDKGVISYAGNVPRKVLEGLLGNEDEIEKLSHFLSLPAQMGSNKFAYESLLNPKVAFTDLEDSQVNQIHILIKERITKGNKLKVLDFGIGKGRLLSTIYENERLLNGDVTKWLDFYGYDNQPKYRDMCIKMFIEIYGNSPERYFNELNKLMTNHDENTFDFIVMCNVFHEIDPKDWITLFTSSTSSSKLLKEEGYLLIVEDQLLAVGEKAHSKGFLVFDELEFKKLFKITTKDRYLCNDYRSDGRLKSHYIPKSCLTRIDSASRKEALTVLNQNSKDRIKELRKPGVEGSFKNGKLHGFWSQQLANSSLALEEL